MNPNSCLFSFFQLFFTLNIYKLQNFSISIRKEKKKEWDPIYFASTNFLEDPGDCRDVELCFRIQAFELRSKLIPFCFKQDLFCL